MTNKNNVTPHPIHSTLLSFMLETVKDEASRQALIQKIDWDMPDVGYDYALLYGDRYSAELTVVHPLSTLCRYVDDATFKACLDRAALAQNEKLVYKNKNSSYDNTTSNLSDWVGMGVLSAVLEHGSLQMLSDLVETLEKRGSLTSRFDHVNLFKHLPNPLLALAKSSNQDLEYSERIACVAKMAREAASRMFVPPTSEYGQKSADLAEVSVYEEALKQAVLNKNQKMIDVVIATGKAKLDPELLPIACNRGAFAMAWRAQEALSDASLWSSDNYKLLFTLLKEVRPLGLLCSPKVRKKGSMLVDDDLHDMSKLSSLKINKKKEELAALKEVMFEIMERVIPELMENADAEMLTSNRFAIMVSDLTNNFFPVLLSCDEEECRRVDGCLDRIFDKLPKGEDNEVLNSSVKISWLPSLSDFSLLSKAGACPWKDILVKRMMDLSQDEKEEFVNSQATEVMSFWDGVLSPQGKNIKEGLPKEMDLPIPAVRVWWSTVMPDASETALMGWLGAQGKFHEEYETLIQRHFLMLVHDATVQDQAQDGNVLVREKPGKMKL